MPTIAARVLEEKALFFWHLGDFRAASAIDQDFRMSDGSKPDYKTYRTLEWTDFKEQQLKAFGRLPVFLAPGNHETIPPDTRESYVQSFTDWLDTAVIKTQRLEDDPMDASVRPYYHWIKNGVDFLTLDNSSDDQFDAEQMRWFERVLAKARSSTSVKTIVLGMHEALPDSLAAGHSMNQYERQVLSGRIVYNELVKFRKDTGKRVYILASHSHFFMDNVYNTACRKATGIEVLPGWIIGTGGAVRYPLPADTSGSTQVITNVYGYLLAKVSFDGEISFAFKEVLDGDVPTAVKARYRDGDTVHACFTANRSTIVHFGPAVPPDCPQ